MRPFLGVSSLPLIIDICSVFWPESFSFIFEAVNQDNCQYSIIILTIWNEKLTKNITLIILNFLKNSYLFALKPTSLNQHSKKSTHCFYLNFKQNGPDFIASLENSISSWSLCCVVYAFAPWRGSWVGAVVRRRSCSCFQGGAEGNHP